MSSSSTTRMVSLPSGAMIRSAGAGSSFGGAAMRGKEQPDDAALPRFGLQLHKTAGLLHKAVDHAQAEAGALADLLGGEERLERPARDLGCHAAAGVGHGHHDVVARPRLAVDVEVGLTERGVARLDRQLAAVRHGVARVEHEIEQRGCQLAGIDAGQPHIRFETRSCTRCARPATGATAAPSDDLLGDVDRLAAAAAACARRRAGSASGRSRARRRSRCRWRSGAIPCCPPACRQDARRLPRMTVSRLLKSCATPPVSWPMASIFWDWLSLWLRSAMAARCCSSNSAVPLSRAINPPSSPPGCGGGIRALRSPSPSLFAIAASRPTWRPTLTVARIQMPASSSSEATARIAMSS